MTSPPRLADTGTSFERDVLASARLDVGSDDGFKRAVMAMGAGAAVMSAATSTAGAGLAVGGGAGAAGAGVLVKWIGLAVLLAGTSTAASVTWVRHRARVTQAAPSPTPPVANEAALEPYVRSTSASAAALPIVEPHPEPMPSASETSAASGRAVLPAMPTGSASLAATNGPSREPLPVAPSLLDEEVEALDRVRASLSARDPSAAIGELDAYDRSFPSSLLGDEAVVLRIDAFIQRGDYPDATSLCERFLAAHPSSPHAPHLRQLIRGAHNP